MPGTIKMSSPSNGSVDTSLYGYDHEGLKVIAHLAWGNVLASLHSEGRIAQMVESLTRCWVSDDVIRVLLRYGIDPEDFGYEVDPAMHLGIGRCSG